MTARTIVATKGDITTIERQVSQGRIDALEGQGWWIAAAYTEEPELARLLAVASYVHTRGGHGRNART